MSTIKLTADMTKNEFRAAFTENFEYIYLRVKSGKGKAKLNDSKFFTEGSEINVDSDVTVEQFEKEATSKTGMEVSIYYETKAEGKNSKFYLARKEDKKTSLADLEEKASKMENIFSQKEYMARLIKKSVDKSVENEDDGEITFGFRKIENSGHFNFGSIDKEKLEEFGFVFDKDGNFDEDKSDIDNNEVIDYEYDSGDLFSDSGINCEDDIENVLSFEDEDGDELDIDYSKIKIKKNPNFSLYDISELKAGYYIQYSRIGRYYVNGIIPVSANKFDAAKLTLETQYFEFPEEVPEYYEIAYDIVNGMQYDGENIDDFNDGFDTWDEPDVRAAVIKIEFDEDGEMEWETIWKNWDEEDY